MLRRFKFKFFLFFFVLAGLVDSGAAYCHLTVPVFKYVLMPDGKVKIIDVSAVVEKWPGNLDGYACSLDFQGEEKCGVSFAIDHGRSSYEIRSAPSHDFTDEMAADIINSLKGQTFTLGAVSALCLYIYVEDGNSNIISNRFVDGICDSGGVPPAPAPASCQLAGDVNIDYGTLSADSLSGLHKTGSTTVTCDKDATVNLGVYNATDHTNIVKLEEDGSLSAKLTVDGEDVSKNMKSLTLKANVPTVINIDSELAVSGTPPDGAFSGSAVAVVSIP